MCDALQINWKLNSIKSNRSEGSNNSKKSNGKRSKAYTLRACSVKKRMEVEHRKALPKKRGPKPRPKSAPMSKYRRKTANLRERQRMGEINNAFENLREKIPNPVLSGRGKCEKLTKINILHVAINYIRAMENLLSTGESGVRSYSEMVRNPIRPNEKPNKFDHLDFEEDTEDEVKPEPSFDANPVHQLAKALKKKQQNNARKPAKKPKPTSTTTTSATPCNILADRVYNQGSSSNYVLPTSTITSNIINNQSNNDITFYVTPSSFSTSIKSCLETSSDSGISVGSSTSSSPTFSLEDPNHGKINEDPLLGSSIMNNFSSSGNFNNTKQIFEQYFSNHANLGSSNNPFDISLTDDVLKEVVGLVDELQDDFPDISFEDPFELFPKNI